MYSAQSQVVDEEAPLVQLHDSDTPQDHKSRSRASRPSIFQDESICELEEAVGEKAVHIVTATPVGFILQMVLFVMLCLVIGLTPFFTQLLLFDPVTKSKTAAFLPQTPYLVDFAMTVILSNIVSLLIYGMDGLKSCWDWKSVVRLSPISLFYGTSQSLEVVAMVYLDSAFRSILNQLKLPLAAVTRRIFAGERRPLVQWCIIAATTTAVIGFIMAKVKSQANSPGIRGVIGQGVIIGLTAVSASFLAAWMTDVKTKKMDSHLICQMAQMRVTTMLVVAAYTVGYAVLKGETHKLLFYGWTVRVFGLSCFLVLKDFLTIYVLKRLSNIWLGMATSAGLGVSYIADILFLDLQFDATCFTFIILVSILVVTYSVSKK